MLKSSPNLAHRFTPMPNVRSWIYVPIVLMMSLQQMYKFLNFDNKSSVSAMTLQLSPKWPDWSENVTHFELAGFWKSIILFFSKTIKLFLQFLLNRHQTCYTASSDCPPQVIQPDFWNIKTSYCIPNQTLCPKPPALHVSDVSLLQYTWFKMISLSSSLTTSLSFQSGVPPQQNIRNIRSKATPRPGLQILD